MEDYLIESVTAFSELNSGATYLVLFHVDKQPPHLGIIHQNEYFSLRYDKLQMGIDPQTILKTVETKKIPTLLFEVKLESAEAIQDIFKAYQSIEKISCLFPIREFFYPDFYEDIQLVFDLLDKLKADQRIIATYSLNLNLISNQYKLKKYSVQEVQKEIKRLQE